MVKVSRKVEYALMALTYMVSKSPGELTSVREVCERFNTPFDTLAKVLQILKDAQILNSSQGVRGGYTLNQDLSQINFLYFYELIEGKSHVVDCEVEEKGCSLKCMCNITSPMHELSVKVEDFLKALSLAQILKISVEKNEMRKII